MKASMNPAIKNLFETRYSRSYSPISISNFHLNIWEQFHWVPCRHHHLGCFQFSMKIHRLIYRRGSTPLCPDLMMIALLGAVLGLVFLLLIFRVLKSHSDTSRIINWTFCSFIMLILLFFSSSRILHWMFTFVNIGRTIVFRSSAREASKSCRWVPSTCETCGYLTPFSLTRKRPTFTLWRRPTNSYASVTMEKFHAAWGTTTSQISFIQPLFIFPHFFFIPQMFFFLNLYYLRITITASCPMNLKYFPLDSQLCPVEIESCEFVLFFVTKWINETNTNWIALFFSWFHDERNLVQMGGRTESRFHFPRGGTSPIPGHGLP